MLFLEATTKSKQPFAHSMQSCTYLTHLDTAYQSSQFSSLRFAILVTLLSTFSCINLSLIFLLKSIFLLVIESHVSHTTCSELIINLHWIDWAKTCDYKTSSCPSKLGGEILPRDLEFSQNIYTQYHIFGLHFPKVIKQ